MCLTVFSEFDRTADLPDAVAGFLDRRADRVVDRASTHRVATLASSLASRLPRRAIGLLEVVLTFHDGHAEVQVVHAGRIERDVAATTPAEGSPRRCEPGRPEGGRGPWS
ncbi:hypothetical protein [Jatrophihabitans fulvus]